VNERTRRVWTHHHHARAHLHNARAQSAHQKPTASAAMRKPPLRSEWDDDEEEADEEGASDGGDSVSASDSEGSDGEAGGGDGAAPAPPRRVPTPEEAAALTDGYLAGGTSYEARRSAQMSHVACRAAAALACAPLPRPPRCRCTHAAHAARRVGARATRARSSFAAQRADACVFACVRAQALQASEVLRESALRCEQLTALLASVDALRALLAGTLLRMRVLR
jgi:hypothetical protein